MLRGDRVRGEFERFVAGQADDLLRVGYLLVGDLAEAEDLVQECLLRVARHWPRVRGMDHSGAYARRVLVNLALDGSKRRSRRRDELASHDGVPPDGNAREVPASDAGVANSELIEALAALPPRQRAVLVLRYFEDLSEVQVAVVLDCSLGTVKSTASRALARLRQTLAQDAPPVPGGEQGAVPRIRS
ncbi:MAG TPA: SigE family RNA polymerase sigma factor [Solirubrobacteraceae bacterium]|nr:SigE family RNA polymerase sigma factor [Solirubrobacteraceae bacterium]